MKPGTLVTVFGLYPGVVKKVEGDKVFVTFKKEGVAYESRVALTDVTVRTK
jgi:hypothetical protein